jgi:hypothetical protein
MTQLTNTHERTPRRIFVPFIVYFIVGGMRGRGMAADGRLS